MEATDDEHRRRRSRRDDSGRVGQVYAEVYSLTGKETAYKLQDGDERFEVLESAIARIIAHGRHDYYKGEQRGICRRCGVAKRDHAEGYRR